MTTIRNKLRDQHGNSSIQTVLILAVGTSILMGLHGIHRHFASTSLREALTSLLRGESGNLSRGAFAFDDSQITSLGNPESNHAISVPTDTFGQPSKPTRDMPLGKDDSLDSMKDELPKFLADSANNVRNAIAQEFGEHLKETIPNHAEYLDAVLDDLVQRKGNLDPLTDAAQVLEEEISRLRRLRHQDLENLALGIEGRLAIDKSLSPILQSLGKMFAMDQLLDQDSRNQSLGHDPNTTPEQAYQAYLETFKTSSGMLADGVIDSATRGGARAGAASEALNNPGVQVAVGLAADRAGKAVAEQLFPTFNSLSHWLYDNGYSPRRPRFPRDWQPPK